LKNLSGYVDSPLAAESTKVFEKYRDNYNNEAREVLEKGINPLNFKGLIFTKSVEDSAAINKIQSGAIIISASGMCEAGRIRHHLKHNLWRKECSIVFVGYQAEGTLGRQILEGARKVKLFGEEVAVNANIYALHALSGHADRSGLLEWVEGFKKKPKEFLLVHGDKEAQGEFEKLLKSKGYSARIMQLGESLLINKGTVINEGAKIDKAVQVKGLDARDKLLNVIESIEDINSINKEMLLERIKKALYE
jgi:metallo-beta-lactamase family protein